MECTRLENWNFCWNRIKNSTDWNWMVATQVTDTTFGVILDGKLKNKREPHIGDMAIIPSLRK